MYMYTYIHVCVCSCVFVFICMCEFVRMCVCACVHINMYIYTHVRIYIYIYIHEYIYRYEHIYIYKSVCILMNPSKFLWYENNMIMLRFVQILIKLGPKTEACTGKSTCSKLWKHLAALWQYLDWVTPRLPLSPPLLSFFLQQGGVGENTVVEC